MSVVIWKPTNSRERITLFGYEGAGKSTAILNILRYCPYAHAWIIDLDTSAAYERLVETEYQDVADRVHIFQIPPDLDILKAFWKGEWPALDGTFITQANQKEDWLVIDPVTQTWGMAQNAWLEKTQGEDMGDLFASLRIEAAEKVSNKRTNTKAGTVDSEFAADKADIMQWPIVNKMYDDEIQKRLHRWQGHFILVAEAEGLRKDASDKEKETYGWIGHKPKGQKSLPYFAHSNIYLDHPSRSVWRMSSAKDRGRALVDKHPVTQGFAFDYLIAIAGWQWQETEDGVTPT